SGRIVSAGDAVSREEALRMMTSMAARFSFDEKNRGSIETGKLGDFVVLDDHFLTCPPERLRTIRADMTIIGGRVVFERGSEVPRFLGSDFLIDLRRLDGRSVGPSGSQVSKYFTYPTSVPIARFAAVWKCGKSSGTM